MKKRNYKLQDVYDYLLENYNLEWAGYNVVEDGMERKVRSFDFGANRSDELMVIARMYSGSRLKTISLDVSNEYLRVGELKPIMKSYQEPATSWKKFLTQRHSEQLLLR